MTKQIIDKHFTENVNYYRAICRDYYKNYLAEDLLQEAYLAFLKVPEPVILKINDIKVIDERIKYLRNIGRKRIAYIFRHRKQCKQHKDGQTSPMFEVNYGNFEIDHFIHIDKCVEEKEVFIMSKSTFEFEKALKDSVAEFRDKDAELRIIANTVRKGLEEEDFNTGVHVMAQLESINAMSKRTGISRTYLTNAHKTKQKELKQLIIKAYETGTITAHTGT